MFIRPTREDVYFESKQNSPLCLKIHNTRDGKLNIGLNSRSSSQQVDMVQRNSTQKTPFPSLHVNLICALSTNFDSRLPNSLCSKNIWKKVQFEGKILLQISPKGRSNFYE